MRVWFNFWVFLKGKFLYVISTKLYLFFLVYWYSSVSRCSLFSGSSGDLVGIPGAVHYVGRGGSAH